MYYIILETILINFFICKCFPKYSYATTLYDNFSDKYISVPQSRSVTRTSLGVFNICSIPGVTRPQKSITIVEASLWFSLSMGYWAAVDSQYMVHNYRYIGTQISHVYCEIFYFLKTSFTNCTEADRADIYRMHVLIRYKKTD